MDVSSVKRKDCYSLFRDDPILQRSRCGPNSESVVPCMHVAKLTSVSDKLDTSQVQFHSEGDRDGLVRTTISWPRVEGAMSYELRLKNGRTHYTRFNATRTVSGDRALLRVYSQMLFHRLRSHWEVLIRASVIP